MAIDLKLKTNKNSKNSYLYEQWLKQVKQQNTNNGYFMVSNSIEEYLPMIKSPAINLYIFYAIHAKNELGYSYYSIDKIAETLSVSKKTITNWNSILQDAGLIIRQQNFNTNAITQLRPTSDFMITIENQLDLDKAIMSLNNDGFKEEINISIIMPKQNTESVFKIFKQVFSIEDNSISRYIILNVKFKDQQAQINTTIQSEWMWTNKIDLESKVPYLQILWNTSNNKVSTTDYIDILTQLSSINDIEKFKTIYPEYK